MDQKKYEWLKYHWEFMRRNSEYKKDFLKVKELHETTKSPQLLRKKEREYGGKWGLQYRMRDPDKCFEELYPFDSLESEFDTFLVELVFDLVWFKEEISADNHLIIDIDLNKVNSLKALKRVVFALLEKSLNRFSEKKQPKKKAQKYLIDYDLILRVGDMKEKEGLKNREIAERVDPRKFRDNPESATRNIGHLYKRYKELVYGGYKNITYP